MEGGDHRMSSVDERIVRMTFLNDQFERNAAQTLATLDRLQKGLKLEGATKGFADVGAASQKQAASLKNVEHGVQSIADRFKAMSIIGVTALATVASKAVETGSQLVKSLTLDPLIDGFREYETNINSVQTILANTAVAGKTLKDVTATLDELNHYSDKTIYNFAEMAKNIGTFTSAGVGLEDAAASIKGIANLAAMAGANSEQASRVMYQLSQAISSGTVSLEDWNSVADAGIGNMAFKRALAETAVQMGTLDKSAVKMSGAMKTVTINGKGFEKSIAAIGGKAGWLTSDVLTNTLQQFTGDLTDAQLAAQGFNEEQIKSIQATAKIAKNAATEVKTMSQLFSTFKEQMGSGWAETWKTIFGDFNEAKGLFTSISNSVGKVLQSSSDARNKMLGDWKKLGGRTALIEGISNAFNGLASILKPIRDAFRQVFPATTGKQLYEMTVAFRNFTEKIKIGADTADKLKRTFAGVFAIFGIGWDIVKSVLGLFGDLAGEATKGSGGFLEFTAKVGDFIVAVREGLKQGEGLKSFFAGLATVLAVPIKLVQKLAGFLSSLFEDKKTDGVTKGVSDISSKLKPMASLGEVVSKVWDKVLTVMGNVWDFFKRVGSAIGGFFKTIGQAMSSAFDGLNFGDLLSAINTGLFAGLVLLVKNFTGGGSSGGLVDSLKEGFASLTGTLTAMQNTLRAATLLQIAAAIGILTISMNVLSKIDAAGLTRAGTAMTVMFTQLLGSMLIFEKLSSFKGFLKMPFVAASMILLGSAVIVLAQAAKMLASLNWEELAKGLIGVTVLMGVVVGTMLLMPNPAGMISTGLGLIALAAGIKILASAVTDLSGLGWEEMVKGLTGVAGLLVSLALFTKFSSAGKAGILQGAGIILLAAGIKILASALKDLGKMSWMEITKGLAAMAGGLTLIAGALYLIPPTALLSAAGVLVVATSLGMIGDAIKDMAKISWKDMAKGLAVMAGSLLLIALALKALPPSSLLSAAAILVVASSLKLISNALKSMAEMSWGEIAKGLIVLAASLGIIALAMIAMTGTLSGAVALLVVAGALTVLIPILKSLGEMSIGEIVKGLLALAGVFLVIGVAGLLLTPVVPVLLALGGAIALLGVGLVLAGAGVLLFATGLLALAGAGAAAAAALVVIGAAMASLIPKILIELAKGLIAFAKVIATGAPSFTKAIVAVINAMINAVILMTPKIVNALLRMLAELIEGLATYVPRMVDAGLRLLTGILNGIGNNIGKVIDAATKVVVNFINGVSKNIPKVIQAGVNLIVNFVNSLANAIRSNSDAMNAAGRNLASAIIEGMVLGLADGVSIIAEKAKNLGKSAIDAANRVLDINSPSKEFIKIGNSVNEGFAKGLDGNRGQIDGAFNRLKAQLSAAMKDSANDIGRLEARLKKLTHARYRDIKAIAAVRKELAQARKENSAERAAYSQLTRNLADEHKTLDKLATQYDTVAKRIKNAQQALADAIKTRDDYNKQIKEQYSDMPSATGETKLATYIADLKKQVEDTKKFSNAIQRLRDLGLNDETYKDLLATGTSALPFVESLLAGGKRSVDEVNKLGKELDAAGAALGKNASSELYQAGVDAAAGLVKGLQNQQKNIEKEMDKIASFMIKAIKKALGIKSPSKEFAKIGEFSVDGLVQGLSGSMKVVEKSTELLGQTTVDSLRKSLSNLTDMAVGNMEIKPVITPVLDLTGVKKTAGGISALLTTRPISFEGTQSQALTTAHIQTRVASSEDGTVGVQKTVTYNQYNSSPKTLSQAEIYRQTNNQLSRAKGAL